MTEIERAQDAEPPPRGAPDLLAGEDLASATLRDARHWLETYGELLRNEEWLLDDRLPVENILRVRLNRISKLRARQEFWRVRAEELAAAR